MKMSGVYFWGYMILKNVKTPILSFFQNRRVNFSSFPAPIQYL
ncbi:hypothetical protein SAMN04488024_103156 [Pedobacter soli]|uniref:Uncharacterized protein n=1 Tax=Pedobacter soli TaxID=390242 RepID=A0A1G6PUL1_9SPHI|nr:hypothetical protein SAMN04488024_103156 [Pedobacter soli]